MDRVWDKVRATEDLRDDFTVHRGEDGAAKGEAQPPAHHFPDLEFAN